MTINEYQKAALRTESGMSKKYPRLLNGLKNWEMWLGIWL